MRSHLAAAIFAVLLLVNVAPSQPPKHRVDWDNIPAPAPVPVQPKPAPVLGAVNTEVADATLALVDGKWVEAQTKKITAKIVVDSSAEWIKVRAEKLQKRDGVLYVTAATVDVIPMACKSGACFGLAAPPGHYRITTTLAGPSIPGGIQDEVSFEEIKGKDPKPDDPVVPEPPDEDDTDLDKTKLRVLIVEETADRGRLPASQLSALTSGLVRNKLNEICAKTNGTPDWRILDDDSDLSAESDIWQEAMNMDRDGLPWLYISDGEKGISMPYPETVEKVLEVLDRYSK